MLTLAQTLSVAELSRSKRTGHGGDGQSYATTSRVKDFEGAGKHQPEPKAKPSKANLEKLGQPSLKDKMKAAAEQSESPRSTEPFQV